MPHKKPYNGFLLLLHPLLFTPYVESVFKHTLFSVCQTFATPCFCRERERERERELANLPRTLATDTLPKFFNDFTRVAHLIIIGATIFYLIIH
ncbi:MAG: hypothetical protein DRJ09_09405 [Bacteroidetes bacterium]|nr:MAG: hypothetical protein DRJ09_09405 [Bacteroidota bacterium]